MRVYVDALFGLNALADYALLLAAARLAGVPTRPWRLIAGAVSGGLYGVAVVPWPALGRPLGLALATVAMALAVWAPRPWRVLCRALVCLVGVGVFAGGATLALAGFGAGSIPLWAVLAALGGALCGAAALADRRRALRGLGLCELEVELGGRLARCPALIDSGNRLRDPCHAAPVVVVDAGVLAGVLPAPLLAALAAGPASVPGALDPGLLAKAGAGWAQRLCLVPYRAVGTAGGMLCGLRADAVRVVGRPAGAPAAAPAAVIAVSPAPLDPQGAFRALVPAQLVEALVAHRPAIA